MQKLISKRLHSLQYFATFLKKQNNFKKIGAPCGLLKLMIDDLTENGTNCLSLYKMLIVS